MIITEIRVYNVQNKLSLIQILKYLLYACW